MKLLIKAVFNIKANHKWDKMQNRKIRTKLST